MGIPKHGQGVVFLVCLVISRLQYTVKGGMDVLQTFLLAQEEANEEVNENRGRQVKGRFHIADFGGDLRSAIKIVA